MTVMKYRLLDTIKAKTKQGELELYPGQVITLPREAAIKLLNENRIKPVERVAYKVYSEVLGEDLWIVDTDEDKTYSRSEGIEAGAPIYTNREIQELKKLPKDDLIEIHMVKKIFHKSKILKVKNGE